MLAADQTIRLDTPHRLARRVGRLPVLVAEALRRQGYHISCLGVVGHADPQLHEICDDFQWIGLGQLGGAIRYFRRLGVSQATMAGKFQKVMLYQPSLWWRHLPDWTGIKTFWHVFVTKQRDRKDDTLLGHADRRVRRSWHHVSSGDRLCPGTARETGTNRGPAAVGQAAKRHRVRLGRSPAKWAGSTSARACA